MLLPGVRTCSRQRTVATWPSSLSLPLVSPGPRRRTRSEIHVPPHSHPAFTAVPTTACTGSPYAYAFSTTSSTALHSYSPLQMAAAVTTSPYSLSFLRMALVFVAGGLFFSSAMAACTAGYAIGKNNVNRFAAMARLVWDNIWLTFTMGLSATRATLLGTEPPSSFLMVPDSTCTNNQNPPLQRQSKKQPWRYKDAWRVFKHKLRETRQKAVEGVEAIRQEVKMCAAAVGPPGLIPLQYMLDRLMPYSIEAGLKEYLELSLADIPIHAAASAASASGTGAALGRGLLVPNGVKIKNVTLTHFSVGSTTPKLEAARVYDVGPHAMAFECDTTWDSQLEATIQVEVTTGLTLAPASMVPNMRFPVTLKNVQFSGPVRVVMAPLTQDSPSGFGATLISFPSMPHIGLDVSVAGGEVTKVLPRLRTELIGAVQRNIAETMIWPKRMVVPSVDLYNQNVLTPQQLRELEVTDPLLKAEEATGSRTMLRNKLDQMSDRLYQENSRKNGVASSETKKAKKALSDSVVELPMPSFRQERHQQEQPAGSGRASGSSLPSWTMIRKALDSKVSSLKEELPLAQVSTDALLENLQKLHAQAIENHRSEVAKLQKKFQLGDGQWWKQLQHKMTPWKNPAAAPEYTATTPRTGIPANRNHTAGLLGLTYTSL